MVGVPGSAASYAAGQDLAPAALRSAGLLGPLTAAGLEVHDGADLPHQAWSPDRDHPLAQNAGQATTSVRQLADRLGPLLARGDIALVLGGNCTITLGAVAALQRRAPGHRDCSTSTAMTTSIPRKAPPTGRWTGWGQRTRLPCRAAWTP